MKKIILTGAKGTIGTILLKELSGYEVTPMDLPDHDISDIEILKEIFPGHDAIIHLAWNTKIDNANTGNIDPTNSRMFFNVYEAALQAGVPRIIMASSVHAQRTPYEMPKKLISVDEVLVPNNPYGAHKVFLEAMGRHYSTKGLEVVCVRFGGINALNLPKETAPERSRFFSHKDAGSLMKACIEAKEIPDKFAVLWGISNNTPARYDLTNTLGWWPEESADQIAPMSSIFHPSSQIA